MKGIVKMARLVTQYVRWEWSQSRRGVAMIMALEPITMLAVMMLGFRAAVRVEYATMFNDNNLIKTLTLTDGAISEARRSSGFMCNLRDERLYMAQ